MGYSLKIIAPDGKGGSTTQYIGQSGMVTETNGRVTRFESRDTTIEISGDVTTTRTDTNGDGIFDHIKTEARIGDGASVVG
ncbi:hypothetical protein DF158_36670, partial [Burkholderia stagnalis]|uniref:hypothetical protein n=1 Tax=Burkholderia stagnalis TaxID=1503054 RepID=UPI000FA4E9E1